MKAKRSAFNRWNANQNSAKAGGKKNQNFNNDVNPKNDERKQSLIDGRRRSLTRERNSVVQNINSGSEKTVTERRRSRNSDNEKSASGISTVEQRAERNSGGEKEDYFDLNVEPRRSANSGRDQVSFRLSSSDF